MNKLSSPMDFRQVHDIGTGTDKSTFTQGDGIIFVDDGFRERQEVATNSSAVVFDVNEFIAAFAPMQWIK